LRLARRRRDDARQPGSHERDRAVLSEQSHRKRQHPGRDPRVALAGIGPWTRTITHGRRSTCVWTPTVWVSGWGEPDTEQSVHLRLVSRVGFRRDRDGVGDPGDEFADLLPGPPPRRLRRGVAVMIKVRGGAGPVGLDLSDPAADHQGVGTGVARLADRSSLASHSAIAVRARSAAGPTASPVAAAIRVSMVSSRRCGANRVASPRSSGPARKSSRR
jgi:hypothetical protein